MDATESGMTSVKDDWYFETVDASGVTEESLADKEGEHHAMLPTAVAWTPPRRAEGERTLSRSGVDVSRMLTFDLETGPDMSRAHLFDLPPLPNPRRRNEKMPCPEEFCTKYETIPDIKKALDELSPCEGWLQEFDLYENDERPKTRKGVLDAIDQFRKICWNEEHAVEQRMKELCTNPRHAMITAMGYAIGDGEIEAVIVRHEGHSGDVDGDVDERECLELFWDMAADCSPLVGYNVIDFDLMLICVRSALLGVRPSRGISMGRYTNNDVVDLFVKLGAKGKCKDVCREFGIDPPAGDLDGSHAWLMYLQDRVALRGYVKSDVFIERELFWMLSGGLWL